MPKRIRTTPLGPHTSTKERLLRTMNRLGVKGELKPFVMNGKEDWFTLVIHGKLWFDVIRICDGTVLVQNSRGSHVTSGWRAFPVGKSTNARAKTETLVKLLSGT